MNSFAAEPSDATGETRPAGSFLAWHHLKCRLPPQWEVTAYAVEDREGRLEFSTRRGFEALFAWEYCGREPDETSMMTAFLRKRVPGAERARGLTLDTLRTRRVGPYLMGWYEAGLPCQAMTYRAKTKRLLTWVFATADPGRIKNVYAPLIESCASNDGPTREYAIHGMHFYLPAEFLVEDMTVLPANVKIVFESRQKARVTLRRWGMPEIVLGGDRLETVYERVLGVDGCRVTACRQGRIAGMEGARLTFEQRGQYQMDKLMGRIWRNGRAWVWLNAEEQRIYALETVGPAKARIPEFGQILPQVGRDEA